ncbi:RrF2 family transcriptional regulator [Methylobrevis pamukkalensis]|uniref:HTH-type transcriptional repressor NsrR n=1 Tax=Methylobrevis pamukkalensis TaxID=1439726 RepID=A0A1E3H1M3_9HYPH|nr:Rrf2 family transcriptional regulator [Methylobrevis pamukkalensis]ODN70233.1 HTH-type transcriptional repressor NsrR [Methylobrevis pamukkalensis]
MQLRNQVEWALHCCGLLAGLPEGRRLSTKSLADFHGVPKEYLSKALQALSTAGIVEGSLGPAGGYRLAKPPSAVSFLDIVEAVEGRRRTFACTEIRRNNPCRATDTCDMAPCTIARVMWEADEAWRERLRATTLADLAAMLGAEIPAETLRKVAAWVGARS